MSLVIRLWDLGPPVILLSLCQPGVRCSLHSPQRLQIRQQLVLMNCLLIEINPWVSTVRTQKSPCCRAVALSELGEGLPLSQPAHVLGLSLVSWIKVWSESPGINSTSYFISFLSDQITNQFSWKKTKLCPVNIDSSNVSIILFKVSEENGSCSLPSKRSLFNRPLHSSKGQCESGLTLYFCGVFLLPLEALGSSPVVCELYSTLLSLGGAG